LAVRSGLPDRPIAKITLEPAQRATDRVCRRQATSIKKYELPTVGTGCVFCNTGGFVTPEPRPHCDAASR